MDGADLFSINWDAIFRLCFFFSFLKIFRAITVIDSLVHCLKFRHALAMDCDCGCPYWTLNRIQNLEKTNVSVCVRIVIYASTNDMPPTWIVFNMIHHYSVTSDNFWYEVAISSIDCWRENRLRIKLLVRLMKSKHSLTASSQNLTHCHLSNRRCCESGNSSPQAVKSRIWLCFEPHTTFRFQLTGERRLHCSGKHLSVSDIFFVHKFGICSS